MALASPQVVAQQPTTKPAPAPAARGADPSGYAALFVDLWLRSDAEANDAAARTVRAMAPGVPLPTHGEAAQPVERAVAVRSAQLAGGAWSITVAVQFAQPKPKAAEAAAQSHAQVRFFAVPLIAKGSGASPGMPPSLAVVAAPAEVAGPRAGQVPTSPYGTEVDASSPLASTAREFLAAFLAGVGEVDRYLAPGVRLPAVVPAPYDEIEVERVAAAADFADGRVGADGTSAGVQVQVRARDAAGGEWPLAYTLRLTARAGRWEVKEVQAGPGLEASWGARADQSSAVGARDAASSFLPAAGDVRPSSPHSTGGLL